jgi:hypothetical protein
MGPPCVSGFLYIAGKRTKRTYMEAPPNTHIDTLEALVRRVREFEERLGTMILLAALNKSMRKTQYERDMSVCLDEVVAVSRMSHQSIDTIHVLKTLRIKLFVFRDVVMYIRQVKHIHGPTSQLSETTGRSRSPLTRSHTTVGTFSPTESGSDDARPSSASSNPLPRDDDTHGRV